MSATYEQRLRLRVGLGGSDAIDAAVALMERHDPDSLEQALGLVPGGVELSAPPREALVKAWDRYFHIKAMPWD